MKGTIIYNDDKIEAIKLYEELLKFFEIKKIEIVPIDRILDADFAVIIGGDGTLLRASKTLIKNSRIDIFAVNAGSLGFLTEIKAEEFQPTFNNYLKGLVKIESRQLLEVFLKGEKIDALNEVVISKEKASSKILNIEMCMENTKICSYKADGIIVATPTGSTAYSLSAGGPIVMPQIEAMVVTPLAPHNLATRPIIISGKERLILTLNPEQKGSIIIDGENEREIEKGEKIEIYYSHKKINLILPEGRDYYGILRDKLKWGDNLC
ncbi:NAD(+)/NADH kinase [uncultured Cetobacterium sp.]|uniref:NAD(+)/NADH kinase n=1 Tax=uncultured Cetobacterium sp. TaxID=527638 RepID=UPI0025EE861C|nr:NAD(+)/NADH kinase [uncultured Cetobacterium sp.]